MLEIGWLHHGRALRSFVDGAAADLSAIVRVLRERGASNEKRVPREHRLRVEVKLVSGRWRQVTVGTSGGVLEEERKQRGKR